jgi:hypothetical protein
LLTSSNYQQSTTLPLWDDIFNPWKSIAILPIEQYCSFCETWLHENCMISTLHWMWMLQTFKKTWKLAKIRMKLQGVSWWNWAFIILIIILHITVTLLYTSWHTKHHSPPHLPKKPLCIPSQFLLLWISTVVFGFSGFHSEVDEKNCTFPGYYAVGSG